jgi:hypothetical protein
MQPRNSDHDDQQHPAGEVAAETREVEPDAPEGVRARLPQQIDDERDEREVEEDRQHLVDRVPDGEGIARGVELRLLLRQRDGCRHPAQQRQQRVEGRLPDRDGQDDTEFPPQTYSLRAGSQRSRIDHSVRLPHEGADE